MHIQKASRPHDPKDARPQNEQRLLWGCLDCAHRLPRFSAQHALGSKNVATMTPMYIQKSSRVNPRSPTVARSHQVTPIAKPLPQRTSQTALTDFEPLSIEKSIFRFFLVNFDSASSELQNTSNFFPNVMVKSRNHKIEKIHFYPTLGCILLHKNSVNDAFEATIQSRATRTRFGL
jgi:hypothetical protein